MSHKSKHDKFHLSFAVVIRLVVFILVIVFAINYLSSKNNVLGESTSINTPELKPIFDNLYLRIPPTSRQKLENLGSSPAVKTIETKLNLVKIETNGFPQKQINDIKKAVVQQIYQNVMKSIDTPTK